MGLSGDRSIPVGRHVANKPEPGDPCQAIGRPQGGQSDHLCRTTGRCRRSADLEQEVIGSRRPLSTRNSARGRWHRRPRQTRPGRPPERQWPPASPGDVAPGGASGQADQETLASVSQRAPCAGKGGDEDHVAGVGHRGCQAWTSAELAMMPRPSCAAIDRRAPLTKALPPGGVAHPAQRAATGGQTAHDANEVRHRRRASENAAGAIGILASRAKQACPAMAPPTPDQAASGTPARAERAAIAPQLVERVHDAGSSCCRISRYPPPRCRLKSRRVAHAGVGE